ncbi:hypothetical protein ACN74_01690 [Escherichia coli]|nr:hypothetical protein ACN74_01690 [Escherichia coli]
MRILNCYMANDSKGHFVTAKEAAKHNRQDVLCCVSCGCPLTLQRGNDGYRRTAGVDAYPPSVYVTCR